MTPSPRPPRPDPAARLPLSVQVFQILLSLSTGPAHGYALIEDIADRTGGEVRLTASTLYDALARLVDDGVIEAAGAPADESDSRRRYYALTPFGREVARLETRRLERLVAMAKRARVFGDGRARSRR